MLGDSDSENAAGSRRTLAWQARPLVELLRLAWPITISTLSYSVMTLTSTWFVAHSGDQSTEAVAGVGVAGVVFFAMLCFGIGLLRSVKTLVSQAVGAGRPLADRDGYLSAGCAVALIAGFITLALSELAGPLLAVMTRPEATPHAQVYLQIRALAAPLLLLFVAMRETRYGESDARAPMRASIVGNLVNVGCDVVLVYWLGWGAAGAAWAGVAGNAAEMSGLARTMWRRCFAGRELRARMLAVWRLGLPNAIQFVMEVGSFLLLTTMISRMSAVQMAGHQVVLQLIHFSFLPGHAISEAASVLAGQAIGARCEWLVRRVALRALMLAGGYAALCTVVFAFGAPLLADAFAKDAAMAGVIVTLVHVSTLFLITDAANLVARGILRGVGDVKFAATVGIATAWALTPPTTWFLGEHLGMGAVGGWIGLSAEIFLGACIVWWRLLGGGWKRAAADARALQVDTADDAALVPS
jgi:MATE family multidrug resistance protein